MRSCQLLAYMTRDTTSGGGRDTLSTVSRALCALMAPWYCDVIRVWQATNNLTATAGQSPLITACLVVYCFWCWLVILICRFRVGKVSYWGELDGSISSHKCLTKCVPSLNAVTNVIYENVWWVVRAFCTNSVCVDVDLIFGVIPQNKPVTCLMAVFTFS